VLVFLGFVPFGACHPAADDGDALAFFDARAKVICRKNFQCCTGSDRLRSSEEHCVASNDINAWATRLRASLEAGSAHLDSKAADSCLATVDALSCEEWAKVIAGADPAPCPQIITGLHENGAGCSRDYDCASLFCRMEPQASSGICTAKGAAGAACVVGGTGCLEGLSCLDDGTGATVCTVRKAAASSCSAGRECSSGNCKSGSCRPECWGEVLSQELFGI
jgi:hypothetical protein